MTALTLYVYGLRCHLCLRLGADTRDHLIPKSKGGADTIDNCRPAHHRCNAKRQDRDLTPELLKEFRPDVIEISVDTSELFESDDVLDTPRSVHFLPEPHQKTTDREATETRAG
ncbi:HNH endonuclease [Aeromicrobium sp. 9AM]|uniref:HNH endonuclease n=1 Tax=Aeromicrobium sp. 9AM TaxID=2653126 RepID=UPI0019154225|nr:HNH endonuclease signature motif containing protein [Aeromicrobium sp. 9AM]